HPPYLSPHAVEPNGQHILLSWQSSSQHPLPHLLEPLGQHILPD
ncbi:23384_t:CDS:1, partial [Gigaspora rosea]